VPSSRSLATALMKPLSYTCGSLDLLPGAATHSGVDVGPGVSVFTYNPQQVEHGPMRYQEFAVIDFRLMPFRERTPEQAEDDPMDRPGGGWKPDMAPEEIWQCNRGYWRFGARAWSERYATFSAGDGRVKCAARISRIVSVGVVPSKGEVRYALEGEVLKPGDPEYDRLMSMVIPWHRSFKYIDDDSQSDVLGLHAKEEVDPEALLASLRDIQPETDDGHRAPYQFLVLLWAMSRARQHAPRITPYLDVNHALAEMLSPFRLADSAPNPANPWYALGSTKWWEIVPPVPTNYKEVHNLNTIAGLRQPICDLVADDPRWAAQAVETITALIGDSPDLQDLIVRLGLSRISSPPPPDAVPQLIPTEIHVTEKFTAEYRALPSDCRQRREAKLQDAYAMYLRGMNHKVSRHQIPVDGQYLYTDLFDETTGDLIEAKASSDRVSMRLALGQILDYAKLVEHSIRTVLVPDPPAQGIIDLFHDYRVRIVWPDGASGFKATSD
jgi:hypothetical protein